MKLREKGVNIWIFVFPAKDDSTDWEASTEKLVQIALTFSWFFSAASKIFVDFSQQVHIIRMKIQIVFTLAGVRHWKFTAFLNPYNFNLRINAKQFFAVSYYRLLTNGTLIFSFIWCGITQSIKNFILKYF